MHISFRVLFPMLAMTLLVSCNDGADAEGQPKVGVSQEQALAFVRSVETAMNEGNIAFVNQAVDVDAMYDRITRGVKSTDADRQKFLESSAVGLGLADKIHAVLRDGGSFRLLRLRWNDGRPRGLYRLVAADGSINYLDVVLGDRGDSAVSIIDVYTYVNGEFFTTAMRQQIERDTQSSLHDLLAGDGRSAVKIVDSLSALLATGDAQGVMSYYNAIPEALKNEKSVQSYRLLAAMRIGEDEYRSALADMQKRFPGNPSLDLTLLDHYYMQKQYDSLLAAINRLDSNLGGDPFLDNYRAVVSMEQGDYGRARLQLENVIAHDSTMPMPYYSLLNLTLHQQDYPATVRMLDLLEKRFSMEFTSDALGIDSTFAGFMQSAAYREWERRRSQR